MSHRPLLGIDGKIALHEAGHAAAAVALGYPLATVTMEKSARFFASCSHATAGLTLEDELVIGLAGGIADGTPTDSPEWLAGADWERVQATALRSPDPEHAMNLAAMRTAGLLRRHWPAVEALARELVRVRTLSGPDAERIIRAAMSGA